MKTSKLAWAFAFIATTVTAAPDDTELELLPTEDIRDFAADLEYSSIKSGTDKNRVATFLNEHASLFPNLNHFNVKKLSTLDVFFGEGSKDGTKNDPTREVFNVSANISRMTPTSNQISYKIEGFNNYDGTNLMNGTLIANFEKFSFTGSLKNQDLEVVLLGTIKNDGRFSGGAYANAPDSPLNQLSFGTSEGGFFGAGNTASVLGVAKFEDPQYDTAFGGVNFTPASSIQR